MASFDIKISPRVKNEEIEIENVIGSIEENRELLRVEYLQE
jgi:hypothetical protein